MRTLALTLSSVAAAALIAGCAVAQTADHSGYAAPAQTPAPAAAPAPVPAPNPIAIAALKTAEGADAGGAARSVPMPMRPIWAESACAPGSGLVATTWNVGGGGAMLLSALAAIW